MKRFLVISAIAAGLLLLVVAVALLVLWRASKVVPDFYAQAMAVERTGQRDASNTLIQKATVLVSDVQKPGRWEALFTEQEVNAWLAVDLKENHRESLPLGVAEPRVVIDPGGMRLACRASRSGVETVLSIELDAYLVEPGVVGVRIRRVRAGAIPLPLGNVLDLIRDMGDRLGLLIRWQQAEGDPVAIVRVNPVVKGSRLVVIDRLELAEDEIYLGGSTQNTEKNDK